MFMKGTKMKIMALLFFAALVGIMCRHRETKPVIRTQAYILAAVALASCTLAAALALGRYV